MKHLEARAMQTVRLVETTGKDGVLSLRIPVGEPEARCEIVVVVQPNIPSGGESTPEERGWPPGYFDDVPGSITDETFFRHPQGENPKPISFE
jgi:hypothetical protein